MKVTIVKYLNPKGKVVEMRKDNFKGSYMPENIIEEYEVEIKGKDCVETDWWLEEWMEGLKRKFITGNYILLTPSALIRDTNKWTIVQKPLWDCDNYILIHNKHKDILEAYLKNHSVVIETGKFAPMTGETEPSKWVVLEKDFIEDYNEEFWYRLKVKDLAWYEDENMVGKLVINTFTNNIHIFNSYSKRHNEILVGVQNSLICKGIDQVRPATESEVLSLVYKPQQKVSKEINLTESNRLMYLFLNNKAECLVENEQEFKLVYDFLDKNCDESLNRYSELDVIFDFTQYNDEFPIVISTLRKWGNVYEWNKLKNRNKNKPLIKFNGETFWEVFE